MKAKSQQSSKAATPSRSTRPSRGQNRPSRPCGRHWRRPRRLGCAQRLKRPNRRNPPNPQIDRTSRNAKIGQEKDACNWRHKRLVRRQRLKRKNCKNYWRRQGLGSRREMEELIIAGQATINGKIAQIGDRGPEDVVRVGKRVIHFRSGKRPRVMLYHKPEGEIVSRDDPAGPPIRI